MLIRQYTKEDLPAMAAIWNEVVAEANAFPQEDIFTLADAEVFFARQSYTGVAVDTAGQITGLYILHPNNVGRCGHIANASYAVCRDIRGSGIGEALVRDCLQKSREFGFRILQFNAVVATNTAAIHLYEKLGFTRLGTVKGGYRLADGNYADIILFYITL